MGYHVIAHVDLSQEEQENINNFIITNSLDVEDEETSKTICEHYFDRSLNYVPFYSYNFIEEDAIGTHEIYFMYEVNFLIDDGINLRKSGYSVYDIKTTLDNLQVRQDVLELAYGLRFIYWDDDRVMDFANWLEYTAIFCSTYELV